MKLYVKNELGSIEAEGETDFCVNAITEFHALCDELRGRQIANQKHAKRVALFREQQQLLTTRDDANWRLRGIQKELSGQ